ncbi:Histamine receptor H3, partial [Caligus rogercresseyi]
QWLLSPPPTPPSLPPKLITTNSHGSSGYQDGNLSFEEQQTMRAIADQNTFPHLDNSFDNSMMKHTASPPNSKLPPVFEFEGLKYIDTARVEPRIAYSPEKTPPQTPDTPRYEQKPFADPMERFLLNNAMFQQHAQLEMVDFSTPPPLLPESPLLARAPSRHDDLDETLEVLEE